MSLRVVPALLLASFAAGCVSLLPDPPPAPRIYPLPAAAEIVRAGAPAAPVVIGVARPNLAGALSGLDIAWVQDGEIGFLPRSAWAGRAPEALQSLLVATLDAQDRVAAGVRVGEGPRADYDLRWDVAAFQLEEADGRREARFAASVKLVETPTRRVVASQAFSRSAPLEARSERLAVSVLQSVAAAAAVEIADWAATQAATQSSPAPQSSAASINR